MCIVALLDFSSMVSKLYGLQEIFQCADSLHKGYLMDMKVLQQCVRANVGDLTFEASLCLSLGEFS